MDQIIVLQSFRRDDVPAWIDACRASVEDFAASRGWRYKWIGDDLFDFAPAWAKERCGTNIWALTDLCRLEWIMAELAAGADLAIWSDIDMLIFDPAKLAIDVTREFGLSYELAFDRTGPRHGVNNALMFFRRGSPQLAAYREACLAKLASAGAIGRTALGPDMLGQRHVPAENIIRGCTILNLSMMQSMLADPLRRLPTALRDALCEPVGAANLCLNERRFFPGQRLARYDELVMGAVQALLAQGRAAGKTGRAV